MAHLEFREDGRPLFQHQLRPGRTVIGRSDRCDVALPSESISRVHCIVERRPDGWWLTDRSRNGTRVNGAPIERHLLQPGDEVGLGTYAARFDEVQDLERSAATTVSPLRAAVHEELVEATGDGVAACQAELLFARGPRQGESVLIRRPRVALGGPGADVELGPELSHDAVRLRVVRGRVMVEPGSAACYLAGQRVRELTPAWVGEEIRVGDHAFAVSVRTQHELRDDLTTFGPLVGDSPAMRKLFGVLQRMAAHDDAVLLTGESGTGKELAARALHECGPRHDGPFVAVNCAAISEGLFESQLFGHEKGAFTGAQDRQEGAFQQAAGGTLFLDEIGELRLEAQAKLLRALESGEIRRVGGARPEFPDVRVVAATNRNLQAMVQRGTFRGDLYFRLEVLTVRLPPLRERKGDLDLLARTLLERHHPGASITPDALQAISRYNWPGNVRELRNVLTRAFVLGGPVLTARSLQFNPWAFEEDAVREPLGADEEEERRLIMAALKRNEGNRTRAARDLGMPRSSLLYKIRRLEIEA